MRTTIDIDDKLLALAKKQALDKGTSLRYVIESALRMALMKPKKAPSRFRLKWKTVRGNPLPGVDISDRDALYERMESRE
jgi:hypothetical protein